MRKLRVQWTHESVDHHLFMSFISDQQDRSRRCQYIQSIANFFLRKYLSNQQNSVKCVIYGSKLVEIDTLLTHFQRNSKICVLVAILSLFSKTRLGREKKCLFTVTRPYLDFGGKKKF